MRSFIIILLAISLYAVNVRILNIEPFSIVKVDNKVENVGKKTKLLLNLQEGEHSFIINHKEFLPLKFNYEVDKGKPNIIILNSKNSRYKMLKKRDFYKTLEVKYKVRRGFYLVEKQDFCKHLNCKVWVKKNFFNFYNTPLGSYHYSNIYKLSNKSGYKYLKAEVNSDYFYSTSTTTDALKDEKLILSPISNWNMLSLTSSIGIYNKVDNYKGTVLDLTYRKNLPTNLFVSIKTRYLEFFDTDTNKTLNGFELGGGVGHLFDNGIMIEGGILKNYLHAYNVEDKDIVPYGEISYKNLQLHYSPTTTELSYINLAPFKFDYIIRFGIGGGNSKQTYSESDNVGFSGGFKIKSKGVIYNSFQYNYVSFTKGDKSSADKDTLQGSSYGLGMGIQLGFLFAESGVMRDELNYKYQYNDWSDSININKDINENNLYYEVGLMYPTGTSISWLHDRYYNIFMISWGFSF